MVGELIARLARFWRHLAPAVRIGLSVYGVVLLLLIVIIGMRHGRRSEVKHGPVQSTVVPAATPIPSEIVIDSVDRAELADLFFEDKSTSVVIKSKVSEQEMVRVANDWLLPQVIQLGYQIADVKRSIEKDKKYLDQNEPLLAPARAETAQFEEEYRLANAALDLPVMPNSSFNEEAEARFELARARLEKARKRLRVLEEGVAAAEHRLEAAEPMLDQIEVEASDARDRLEKLRALDPKILPIIYEYAISGLTKLPLLRFLGRGDWDVRFIRDISLAFEQRFRHSMPVSALGQSETHDRLGWDHTHAADVAVHPGSAEGQWLISYLRSRQIPFMAFRRAVPGVATGPHVHIGLASHRLR